MIPKSGHRFSEKIMLQYKIERDAHSKKSHPAPGASYGGLEIPGATTLRQRTLIVIMVDALCPLPYRTSYASVSIPRNPAFDLYMI
jgi:hypothetical protein